MGSEIFESIGIGTDLIVILLLLLVIIQFVLLIGMQANYKKLNQRLSKFTSGRDAENLEEVLMRRFSEMRQIVKNEKQQNKDISNVNDKFLTTFCKIGLVKYDAFPDTSGNSSFSLALLTETFDGIVITSMHSREGCYTYCKEISNGESKYTLSEEEQIAINVAKGQEGARAAAERRENNNPIS